jgi:HAD superfamily hydrolase (TIGR01484 family)
MYYLALASDYDGTLAQDGRICEATTASLKRLRESGRKLVMVSGRIVEELLAVCPQIDLFDCVVAENGALIYWPQTRKTKPLCEPLPKRFVEELRARKVAPLQVGEVLAATWEPNEVAVLETIRDLGLDLHVVFNKGAVMILPSGLNKSTGLRAALQEMKLSPHNVVGIGDAENDHPFLDLCECSVAVGNALPAVKKRSDFVIEASHGAAVSELIDHLIRDDLAAQRNPPRRFMTFGAGEDGRTAALPPHGARILICGPSGSGKSTLATALIEMLLEQEYQFCLIDPEGDYDEFESAVVLGSSRHAPEPEEIIRALENPAYNVIVNLLNVRMEERPRFLSRLAPAIQKLRDDTGRPHWIVLDETHHMLPAGSENLVFTVPDDSVLITTTPDNIDTEILRCVDIVIATEPGMITSFCELVGETAPEETAIDGTEAVVWFRRDGAQPITILRPKADTSRLRHKRKYAEGELPEDRSFYFRGPQQKLNLRASNLITFVQLGDGVDDETWDFHLRRGDYSKWITESLKDNSLAGEISEVEHANGLSSHQSRAQVRSAIERRYTAPA